ncbi:M48 family metallopeptidase [Ktedonospora formicarum]|uniref:Ste24 endopeptidase n=1 Tax=Ktedonospora formicarum TaxID=2778364 RepID=A0A8J3MRP9_9CHLR|nr:M48 family metallopeptidase [Ktedonospora formicarum]GHO43828.1 hypothetical protein KSX_19910 [Ktedonospora formicarum]
MEIDKVRQKKAREYARKRRQVTFLDMGIVALSLVIILLTGWDKGIRDLVRESTQVGWLAHYLPFLQWQPLAGWYPWQTLLYFLLLIIGYQLITMPAQVYGGFVLPRRYGISIQTLSAWLSDLGKNFVLSLALEAVAVSLVYALLAVQPQWWWLWTALVMLFFSVVMANLAPVLIFPLFYKFKPLPEGELTERLMKLAASADTRVQGVFTMQMSHKTTATNAVLMGLGNTRRIVLGDTMTDRYSEDEIEVVLAHELGHHVHRDIWKMIFSQAVLTLGGLGLANLALHQAVEGQGRYQALTDPATLPFLLLLTAFFSLIVMPIGNVYSRHMEFQADEYALQITQKIDAFKSAMRRLANQNLADISPSPLIEFLFHSHPSVRRRLQHADDFAERRYSSLKASLNMPRRVAVSSTEPPGMVNNGSSTPRSAH